MLQSSQGPSLERPGTFGNPYPCLQALGGGDTESGLGFSSCLTTSETPLASQAEWGLLKPSGDMPKSPRLHKQNISKAAGESGQVQGRGLSGDLLHS